MNRFLLIVLAFFFSCTNNKNNSGTNTAELEKIATDTANFTTVQWIDSIQDVGVLNLGETSQIKFHFKNTGAKPLFIVSAVPGCGCTVADFPKGPIAPGKEGEVVASFNTNKGYPGTFNKSVTVTTNTRPNGNSILSFTGTIKTKERSEDKPENVDSTKSE